MDAKKYIENKGRSLEHERQQIEKQQDQLEKQLEVEEVFEVQFEKSEIEEFKYFIVVFTC